MTREVLVSVSAGETRLLLAENGADIELFHDRMTRWPGLGMILDGRVAEIRPDLSGAFIDLGRKVTGFMPRRAGPEGKALKPGDRLSVRVTRTAQGGKGPRLTARRLDLPEGLSLENWRGLAPDAAMLFAAKLTPHADHILADDSDWAARLAVYLAKVGETSIPIDLDRDGEAARRIDEAVDAALQPSIALTGGGEIHMAETRACSTIDVDSGAARGSALEVNLDAVPAIARTLRLKAVGGLVVVDFIDMPRKADRLAVETALRHAMKSDRELGEILPISRLGLLEMARSRRGPSLADLYHDHSGHPLPEAAALAALRRVEGEMNISKSPGLLVTVARPVRDWLSQHPEILERAGNRWLKPVEWRADAGRAVHDIEIEGQ